MSMTIEKAIDELGGYIGVFDDIYDYELKELWPALELAVSALREKLERENPKPLTIEELRQMDGEPVYVSDLQRPKESEYCIIHANDKYGHGDENKSAQISGCECFWYDFETYGDTWIAYRHKPKEV